MDIQGKQWGEGPATGGSKPETAAARLRRESALRAGRWPGTWMPPAHVESASALAGGGLTIDSGGISRVCHLAVPVAVGRGGRAFIDSRADRQWPRRKNTHKSNHLGCCRSRHVVSCRKPCFDNAPTRYRSGSRSEAAQYAKPGVDVPQAELDQALNLVSAEFTVAQNLAKKTRSDGFAGMHRHDSRASIFVAKKVMTAFDAKNFKSGLLQCRHQLLASNTGR